MKKILFLSILLCSVISANSQDIKTDSVIVGYSDTIYLRNYSSYYTTDTVKAIFLVSDTARKFIIETHLLNDISKLHEDTVYYDPKTTGNTFWIYGYTVRYSTPHYRTIWDTMLFLGSDKKPLKYLVWDYRELK